MFFTKSDHLNSQKAALMYGINAFEPYLNIIHKQYRNEELIDWPMAVLATTLQTSAISLFKLLPELERRSFFQKIFSLNKIPDPLDMRSIASIVRNIVDTHDAIDMFLKFEDEDKFNFHRDILNYYMAGRIAKVQDGIDKQNAQQFYKDARTQYWKKIMSSPLYDPKMNNLKRGESIYYQSRKTRIKKVCGKHTDFVSGVLADISTYIHSVPPSIWFSELSDMYVENKKNCDMTAIWIRIANVYFAHCIDVILYRISTKHSNEISKFLYQHQNIFQE